MQAGEHRKDEAEVSSTMAGAEGTAVELVQTAPALTHTLVTFVSVNMVPSLSRLFLLPFRVQREADEPPLKVIFISSTDLLERLHGGSFL